MILSLSLSLALVLPLSLSLIPLALLLLFSSAEAFLPVPDEALLPAESPTGSTNSTGLSLTPSLSLVLILPPALSLSLELSLPLLLSLSLELPLPLLLSLSLELPLPLPLSLSLALPPALLLLLSSAEVFLPVTAEELLPVDSLDGSSDVAVSFFLLADLVATGWLTRSAAESKNSICFSLLILFPVNFWLLLDSESASALILFPSFFETTSSKYLLFSLLFWELKESFILFLFCAFISLIFSLSNITDDRSFVFDLDKATLDWSILLLLLVAIVAIFPFPNLSLFSL